MNQLGKYNLLYQSSVLAVDSATNTGFFSFEHKQELVRHRRTFFVAPP